MENAGSWMQSVFVAVAWSVLMTYRVAKGKPATGLSRIGAGYFIYGLALGLLLSFGWRALQMPVILVALPSAAYGLFLLWSARLKLSPKS